MQHDRDGTLIRISAVIADVAELADALDLGSSARKGVGVQVSPSAPITEKLSLPVPTELPRLPGYL